MSYLISQIGGGLNLDEMRSVLTGWRPSRFYPARRRWYSEYRKRCVTAGSLDANFDRVVEFLAEYVLYKEKRRTRHEKRCLTASERSMVDSDFDNAIPSEKIHPDQIFKSEDGTRKAFRLFRPGEFLFHVHEGVEE